MADWVTISQIATAAGTLVLAAATFGSIRSAKRSTDLAERSLRAGLRPLLVPSRDSDDPEQIRFGDNKTVVVDGHGGVFDYDAGNGNVYLALALRNGGAGLAVIHGWGVSVNEFGAGIGVPEASHFRRQNRDFYIPAGDTGIWQGAIRRREDPDYEPLVAAARAGERLMIDVIYGDMDGGQRTISRFGLTLRLDDTSDGRQRRSEMLRVWVLDGEDPRSYNEDLPLHDDGLSASRRA